MDEGIDYFKQSLFILTNLKMREKDSSPLLKAKIFFMDANKQEIDLPLYIANFPYLAMGIIKIPKSRMPPLIKIWFQVSSDNSDIIEKTIKPHFSSVISIYISTNNSKPDLNDYKYLYRRFLNENQNSVVLPTKESIKLCRSFILKKSKYSYFAPFFLAASFYLTDPIAIQYVQFYSQLRINGRIRSINELVDYSTALYSFLINEKTQSKFLLNSNPITKNIGNNQNNNNNNNNDDDNDDNDNNNMDAIGSIDTQDNDSDDSSNTEKDDCEDDLSSNRDQALFRKLFKETISDVLNDLEKAELHGLHSSILFLACIFTDVFKKDKVVLPRKWHFLPIELISHNQNDQKHTGRFLPDNFSFVETSVSNNALSAISCYSPLFHNEIKNLAKTIVNLNRGFQARDAIILAGLKLQQLNRLLKRSRQKITKLNFIYFYSMPNPDYVKKLFEIVSLFNLKSRKKGMPSTELIAEQKFAQIYWRTIFHYIPNRAVFPAIVPKPIYDQKNSPVNVQFDQADDNVNKIIKEHTAEHDEDFYQKYYYIYLKNMLST